MKVTTWYLIGIFVLSLGLHFVGLNKPEQVVFDEVHFGKFITSYCCSGERFFDIHPPHGKLPIALSTKIGGYKGGFSFDHIGQAYGQVPIFALRFVPALIGTFIPLLFFILLRQLKASPEAALLGAICVLFDNALLVQTRIIALDGQLILATFGAFSLYLYAISLKGQKRVWAFVGVGALCGLAVGTKFTGLSALVFIGSLLLIAVIRKQLSVKQFFIDSLITVAAALLMYFGGWYIHFSILTKAGAGDVWGLPTGQFWLDVFTLQKKMLTANYNLTAGHPYSSSWWSWPLMQRPVFYWSGSGAYLYFLGNPVVWWSAFFFFLLSLGTLLYDWWYLRASRIKAGAWILLLGYVISFGPLMRVPRALFLYHYLTPLLFSILLGLLWIDEVLLSGKDKLARTKFYSGTAVVVILFFFLFSPYTFGFSISETWHSLLVWFPAWR